MNYLMGYIPNVVLACHLEQQSPGIYLTSLAVVQFTCNYGKGVKDSREKYLITEDGFKL